MTEDTTQECSPATAFTDSRNISVGNARVIWAKCSGRIPEGWVLPGGSRTTDYMTAYTAAQRMHLMAGGAK